MPQDEVVITVRGAFETMSRPERATVELDVAVEGKVKDAVQAGATEIARSVAATIKPLFDRDAGPVTWWSSDQLRTWSQRPWNQDGKQLPHVHNAALSFRVKFKDFAVLGRWVGDVAAMTGVRVSGITWALTEVRRRQLTEEAREAAVHDARTKAQGYAAALGLGEVRVVALADTGMLDGPAGSHHEFALAASGGGARRHAAMGADEGLSFSPQDITISASVDARFAAPG